MATIRELSEKKPWINWVLFFSTVIVVFLIGLFAASIVERRSESQLYFQMVEPIPDWEPRNEGERLYWNHKQHYEVVITAMSLVKYVDGLDLSAFTRPVLVVYSPKDQIVRAEKITEKFALLGSKDKKIVEFTVSSDKYQHVLAGDILSPDSNKAMVALITDFLREHK